MIDSILEVWIVYLKRYPIRTSVVSIIGIITIITYALVGDYSRAAQQKTILSQNPSFQQQIDEMNRLETSLKNLQVFVANQKQNLQDNEVILVQLQQERDKLAPIVASDRQLVTSLIEIYLDAQRKQNEQDLSRERVTGFVMGVISSLVASILWFVVQRLLMRRKIIRP